MSGASSALRGRAAQAQRSAASYDSRAVSQHKNAQPEVLIS